MLAIRSLYVVRTLLISSSGALELSRRLVRRLQVAQLLVRPSGAASSGSEGSSPPRRSMAVAVTVSWLLDGGEDAVDARLEVLPRRADGGDLVLQARQRLLVGVPLLGEPDVLLVGVGEVGGQEEEADQDDARG